MPKKPRGIRVTLRTLITAFACLAAIFLLGVLVFLIWLGLNLRPAGNGVEPRLFVVDEGSSARQIAENLKALGLIRNSSAFIIYIDAKHFRNRLQAGTYKFSSSMAGKDIATKLAKGEVDKNWLTILPGKRLDQIKQEFISSGYSAAQTEAAFDTALYKDEPLVAQLPAGSNLEGLLYPDSFQKDRNTPAEVIVRQSIEETQSKLTADIHNGFASQGLSDYQGIILASIVEQESGSASVQPTIAQVFLSRLKQNIAMGSDVTAFYASSLAGQAPSVQIDSPYNTRLHPGLPPGPIGNITASALTAVAHPASTDYLYFVAGDDGTVHFSHTEAEHEAAVAQYCKKLCK